MRVKIEDLDLERDRVVLVRLVGELSVETAPQVRRGLLKAVASQPKLVVADVAGMCAPDDVTLAVFPAIDRHAAAWPGIPLVLALPSPALLAALERTAVCRYLPVFDSVREACRAVDRTQPRRLVERLPAAPQSVRHARALVRTACAQWGLTALADVAELVMTELVSNAARHVGDMIQVSVALRQRYLHLSVRDRSTAPPRLGHGDGRGLLLVDAMAVAWGSTSVEDGKVVWATLRLP